MPKHALLSPSSADRWTECPGSVRLVATVAPTTSEASDQGTCCHAALEAMLSGKGQVKPGMTFPVGEGRGYILTEEMLGWVREVYDWVSAFVKANPHSQVHSEERLKIGKVFGKPDAIWGTADVIIVTREEMVILDAKFGYNDVPVEGNQQLLLYALGAMHEWSWIHNRARLVIHQPRTAGAKEWVVKAKELEDWVDRFKGKVTAALQPDAPLVPSEGACRWCPAAGVCPALQQHSIQLAQTEFMHPETLPREKLLFVLERADQIREALDAAEAHARKLLELGQTLPGFKLVAGTKRRVWVDEGRATTRLTALGYKNKDLYESKFITPAAAEKLVGKANAKKLQDIIITPKGEPTLAKEDDPREPLLPEFTPIKS